MAIIVNLDIMMARRKISLGELAEKIDITPANLSILKTGKAKAIRFSTLEAICKVLDCQPADINKGKSLYFFRHGLRGLHGFCQMHLLKPCNPRNPCLNLLSLFPFFCLKCQRIHTYLLYHRQQSIATGRRQMISQTYLIDKIKISIQYFIGRMPRKDFDQ